ncbi:hypothetical protein BHAOGJBA_0759 [Methylobacterium hispanicum]|uniref:Uncharacterized protein n=1 Tax=Methylobacterium hispanicum TaxID=270350 RepID=A0AAV4ZFT0_9HYPH|nr:hypothetical protein [Methylobacterium hispanicum]GJD87259.1 hypothetical protein BHAOGJBA_0759 [Methylobacterium hispanicum]
MTKKVPPVFGPRIEHPKQTDMIPLLDNIILAQQVEAARHSIGANGPPTDEPIPADPVIAPLPELDQTYANLDRMYSSVFGPLWHGKASGELGVSDERIIRRWRDGEGKPGEAEIGKARDHLLGIAIKALVAIGETDLATPLVALKAGRRSAAQERAVKIHERNLAVAAAKKAAAAAKEDARLARFEAWWKTDCARRTKIAAETIASPRFIVSLARPSRAT